MGLYFANLKGEVLNSFDNSVANLDDYDVFDDGGAVLVNRRSEKKLYFFDPAGVQIGTHFHDSAKASPPLALNSKIAVYWNATELVYVDREGKELGTFKLARGDHEKRRGDFTPILFKINDSSVVALQEFKDETVLSFMKLDD